MNKREELDKKRLSYFTSRNITCKCGHRIYIGNRYKKCICSWCGHMVYVDKKDEFKSLLKTAIKNA